MSTYHCPHCNKQSYERGGRPICCHCGKPAPKADYTTPKPVSLREVVQWAWDRTHGLER
jgi:ribosomal protein L37AE/L43A